MKKFIQPDAFIASALEALEIPSKDGELFRVFLEKYADKIDILWREFLEEETYERLLNSKPSLRMRIVDTMLSQRTKNALEKNYMETVGQLAQYSPDEIRKFRGVGECIVAEITEYMATIGFPLRTQGQETEEERKRRLESNERFLDSFAGKWSGNK